MYDLRFLPMIGIVSCLTLVVCLPTAPGQDVFQGLGDFPGGDDGSRAMAVSPDGQTVVGFSDHSNGEFEAFRWTASGGMVGLGVASGGTWSQAWGISSNGVIVGQSNSLFGQLGVRWLPNGTINVLGDLPGGAVDAVAFGISANGNVIVGRGTTSSGQEAFRWTEATGMQSLGIQHSSARAVSGDGTTIVGSFTSDGNQQAFHWQNGNAIGLGNLPGAGFQSAANAVSDDGSVVVGRSGILGGPGQAFRWTAGEGMVGLGQLGGSTTSEASAVSGDGSIIVGQVSGNGLNGFIWDPQQGMRRLNDVLTNDFGMDVSDWTFLVPTAISADGLTIVGSGRNSSTSGDYDREAFRVSVDARWIRSASGQWNDRSNWAFGINPNELHDLLITPTTGLNVTKSSGTSTIRSLQLNATAGTATLNLQDSTVNVMNQTTIGNGGRLTGNGTFNAVGGISNLGTIDLGTGLQVLGGAINNLGLVRGHGEIASRLDNSVVGEIRVGPGQHMRLTGVTSPNLGLIDVTGGTFEVSRSYNNEGPSALIYGRDATLRFNGGLTNGGSEAGGGSIGISFGTTDIHGDIDNRLSGIINVSGGANVTFLGDLAQNGTLQVVRVGNTISRAVMFGEFSGFGGFVGGGDVFALGDLRPGNSPASVLMDGNLYFGSQTDSYFEIGGLELGEFDQIRVTGELGLAGDLFVSLIDGHTLGANQTYLIADVGGNLFGQFFGLNEGSLVGNFGGQNLFITYEAGSGNDIALYTAIPEPSAAIILGLVLCACTLSRRNRTFATAP